MLASTSCCIAAYMEYSIVKRLHVLQRLRGFYSKRNESGMSL